MVLVEIVKLVIDIYWSIDLCCDFLEINLALSLLSVGQCLVVLLIGLQSISLADAVFVIGSFNLSDLIAHHIEDDTN